MLLMIVWIVVFVLIGVLIILLKGKLGTTDQDESQNRDKKSLSEKFKEYWRSNYRSIKLPAQVFVWLFFFYIVPEPDNYLWFSFAYIGILYIFASNLIDKIYVFTLKLKEGRIRLHKFSSKHYQSFKKEDEDGKPTYAKWRLKGKQGPVVLADDISLADKKITINEMCSNAHVVRDVITAFSKIKERAIKLRNRLAEIVQMREADAMREAYKIYRKNPIISLFSEDDALDDILDPDKYNQDEDENPESDQNDEENED